EAPVKEEAPAAVEEKAPEAPATETKADEGTED
ncbi:MAG: 30S ribosomal protein S16, partial [Bacteroidetes bacterium]